MDVRHGADEPRFVEFGMDLGAHERTRREQMAAVMADYDPAEVLAREAEAWTLLMSGLDDEQQAVHRMLSEAGVLDA
jgi:hypothetical protein